MPVPVPVPVHSWLQQLSLSPRLTLSVYLSLSTYTCTCQRACVRAGGRGTPVAPREVSESLRALVYRAAPRGLTDPAEDVCAAAARAVRLIMNRFLPSSAHGAAIKASPSPGAKSGGGGSESKETATREKQEAAGVPQLASGGGGGEGVFDLVWKALEGLDQDSACVEACIRGGGLQAACSAGR